MIEPLLIAVLNGDPRVTAIVGSTTARIQADTLAQGTTLPALVYQQLSEVTGYTHDGPDLVKFRIQIDAYATTRLAAITLSRAVRDAFHDYPGLEQGIQDFEAAGRQNIYEPETKLYRTRSDWFATVRDQAA